jgi:chromobox protein 1
VEAITDHTFDEDVSLIPLFLDYRILMAFQGNIFFEVKWEGYEKKSERTLEPEENLL